MAEYVLEEDEIVHPIEWCLDIFVLPSIINRGGSGGGSGGAQGPPTTGNPMEPP